MREARVNGAAAGRGVATGGNSQCMTRLSQLSKEVYEHMKYTLTYSIPETKTLPTDPS